MTINLCLDTNIYLSFYHFSDNDLTRLNDILTLIDNNDLNIILPEQIKNEFVRNRENKINDALQKLRSEKLSFSLPKLIDNYPEKEELNSIFGQYQSKKNDLLGKLETDISNYSLQADVLISDIFKKATCIKLEDEVWERAKKRFDLGNPPGKDKSYGDAIVWETILEYGLTLRGDIELVSVDGDYNCALNKNELNNFLKLERGLDHRRQNLYFHSSLNSFFQKHFPNIKINEEYIKNKRIENFCTSRHFDATRYWLRKICTIEDLSFTQVNDIIGASIENDQIYRANSYSPWIGEHLIQIIEPYKNRMSFTEILSFYEIYDSEIYQELCDSAMYYAEEEAKMMEHYL